MLKLYNSLTRAKEEFKPLDANNVRLYVCGPTVYDAAHIGNARPVIVFDVLYRLLRHLYGETHVKYVRNITDVDDKIIDRARRDFPELDLNAAIKQVTTSTTEQFHADVAALGCLEPDEEPKATDHIEAMKEIIATLIAKDFAYAAKGHVLFRVDKMADYGKLSGRSTDAMLAEARIEAAEFKENPMDFVLWKPSDADQPGWDSPWGRGRPGWHLECSAMARAHLGEVFDIHGGGVDLKFPHHENEIAQSRCAFGTTKMANIWMHNGFLKVEGEKMSKTLGNFVTINELLETVNFGNRIWRGPVLRYAMLMTHYRQPIDFSEDRLKEANRELEKFSDVLQTVSKEHRRRINSIYHTPQPTGQFLEAICDDLNTPRAIAVVQAQAKAARSGDIDSVFSLASSMSILGIELSDIITWEDLTGITHALDRTEDSGEVGKLVAARNAARAAKNFTESDRIRDELDAMGITLKDTPEGTTWEVKR